MIRLKIMFHWAGSPISSRAHLSSKAKPSHPAIQPSFYFHNIENTKTKLLLPQYQNHKKLRSKYARPWPLFFKIPQFSLWNLSLKPFPLDWFILDYFPWGIFRISRERGGISIFRRSVLLEIHVLPARAANYGQAQQILLEASETSQKYIVKLNGNKETYWKYKWN